MDANSYKKSVGQLLALYKQKKFWDAFELVEDLLVQYPYSLELLVRRAMIIQLLDENERKELPTLDLARGSLELAHELAPLAIDPCIELGYFEYAVNDQPAEGLKYFQQAEENALAGLKEALIGQIKCHLDVDDKVRAKVVFDKAVLFLPDDDEIEELHYEIEEQDAESQ